MLDEIGTAGFKTMIKIKHIITETHGGAGVAARRLHEGLLRLGVNSRLIYRRGYCALPKLLKKICQLNQKSYD